MEYTYLGDSGLQVSALSLGAWVTYGGQVGEQVAYECMQAAIDAGVNFFDNAEAYAHGEAETVMGNVIKKAGCFPGCHGCTCLSGYRCSMGSRWSSPAR